MQTPSRLLLARRSHANFCSSTMFSFFRPLNWLLLDFDYFSNVSWKLSMVSMQCVCVCVCFFATEIVFTVIKKKHSMLLFFLFLSFFLCNYHPRGWMSLPWARTAPFYSNVEKRSPFGNMTIDSSIIHFESTRFDLRSFLQMFSRSNGSCLRGSFLRFPSVPRYNFDEKHAWL